MSTPKPIRVLLVEGNPSDALALEAALRAGDAGMAEVKRVARLVPALELLEEEAFDAVLLDLALADSRGVETFTELHDRFPSTPVLVLTAVDDRDAGVAAVQAGAQDYLVKQRLDPKLLNRAVRHAIERVRLQRLREEERRREQHDRELRSMEEMSAPSATALTAGMHSAGPLRSVSAQAFDESIADYRKLLERALERRVYRIDNGLSEELRGLGERLGFLRASPRDVVEIHTTALKQAIAGESRARTHAYLEEGRLMVLELMGHLTSFYRRHCPASPKPTAP